MDVIPMRVKKKVAYVFPGTLFSGPGSEELNWKTVGLRPVTTVLQSLIKPPSQIISPFVIQDPLSFKRILRAGNFLLRRVPLPLPDVEPDTADRINVSRTSNLVMTEDAWLKENANPISAATR
jgi:hypothetical protein